MRFLVLVLVVLGLLVGAALLTADDEAAIAGSRCFAVMIPVGMFLGVQLARRLK